MLCNLTVTPSHAMSVWMPNVQSDHACFNGYFFPSVLNSVQVWLDGQKDALYIVNKYKVGRVHVEWKFD